MVVCCAAACVGELDLRSTGAPGEDPEASFWFFMLNSCKKSKDNGKRELE